MKLNVGVFFGGESVEHEVSIISAHQAMEALDKNKYKLGEYNSLFFVAVPESGNKKNLSQRIRVCTFGYK